MSGDGVDPTVRRPAAPVPVIRRFERREDFVSEYAAQLSLGGIFVPTSAPLPVGTSTRLDFQLTDGSGLFQAVGGVSWVRRRAGGPDDPSGMAIRFQALDQAGRLLLLDVLEEHVKTGGSPFEIEPPPADAETHATAMTTEAPLPNALRDSAPASPLPAPAATPPSPAAAPADPFPAVASAPPPVAGDDSFDPPWGEKLPEIPDEFLVAEDDRPELGDEVSLFDDVEMPEIDAPEIDAPEIDVPEIDVPEIDVPDGATSDVASLDPVLELEPPSLFQLEPDGDPADADPDGEETAVGAPSPSVPPPPAVTVLPTSPAGDLSEEPTLIRPSPVIETGSRPPAVAGAELSEEPTLVKVPAGMAAAFGDEASADDASEEPTLVRPPSRSPAAAESPRLTETGVNVRAVSRLAGADQPAPGPIPIPMPVPAPDADATSGAPYWTAAKSVDADPGPRGLARWGRGAAVVTAVVVVAALALLAFFLRDVWLPAGDDRQQTASRPSPGPPAERGSPPLPPSSPDPGPVVSDPSPAGTSPAGSTATPPVTASGPDSAAETRAAMPDASSETAAAAPVSTTTPPAAVPPPAVSTASRVETIRWAETSSGTTVTIVTDGPVDRERVITTRLGGSNPRLVIRLMGISTPYRGGTLGVSSAAVRQIRIGFHPRDASRSESELHVVLDLASDRADMLAEPQIANGRLDFLVGLP